MATGVPLAAQSVRPSAQVAVDHAAWRVGCGDQTKFRGPGEERMAGQNPDGVAERPRPAELGRPRVPGDAVGDRAVQVQPGPDGVDDLVRVSGPAVDDLDGDVLGLQRPERDAGTDDEAPARAEISVVGLDVLDPHSRPRAGDPLLPRGQLARAGVVGRPA